MVSAIKPSITTKEIIVVNSKKISCDGGSGSSNHPLIYLNMGEKNFTICPYCSKYFTIK